MSHTKSGLLAILLVVIICYVPVNSQFQACLSPEQTNNPVQTENNPYRLVISPSTYTPGLSNQVLIFSNESSTSTFQEIYVQAKSLVSGLPLDTMGFTNPQLYRYLICTGVPAQMSTVINEDTSDKALPGVFSFVPTQDLVGDIEIVVSVERNNGMYWISSQRLSSAIINNCLPNPCENGGTCTSNANGFTCQCTTLYSGPECVARIINVENLANGVFDVRTFIGFGGNTRYDYVFTMVPINSLVDIYNGEDLTFEIGNGDVVGSSAISLGQNPVRIAGNTFWLRIDINTGAARPFEFLLQIYQFFNQAPDIGNIQLPFGLQVFGGTFYFIQEVPPGSIVSVTGITAGSLRFGTGRIVGRYTQDADRTILRLGRYDTYVWYCLTGPVPLLGINVLQCNIDPCDSDPCDPSNFCQPHNETCDEFYCGVVTASECSACFPNSCLNGGICRYDTSLPESFSCQCSSSFSGSTCQDGEVDHMAGGVYDLTQADLFIPVLKNFYIHFLVIPNSVVTIIQVQGFTLQYGLGPIVKLLELDAPNRQFTVTGTGQFWVCLIPNGGDPRFLLSV